MPAKKKARVDAAVWECQSDDGWTPFATEDIKLLETEYAKGGSSFVTSDLSFNKGFPTKYTFDFVQMIQTNNDSKKTRAVRRMAPLSEAVWEWKDDSGLFVAFYDDDSTEIERMYVTTDIGKPVKTKDLSFNKGYGTQYTFVFARAETAAVPPATKPKLVISGTQKNEESGKVRELRRVTKKEPWSVEGFGIAGAMSLPTEAALVVAPIVAESATTAAPTTTTTTAAEAVPPALVKASTLSLPPHWKTTQGSFKELGANSLVEVAAGTEEYQVIGNSVLSTLGHSAKISRIVRIENATLWTFYAMTKSHIAKRCPGGDPVEKLLFYGERNEKNMETIGKLGFDIRIAEDGNFGIGLHFGVQASYCDTGRCLQKPDGSKHVFVCRATLGMSAKGAKSIRRPPPKDPKKPTMDLYDSCFDQETNPNLYILFNNSQAYPEYIVSYV